ncbi:TetR/AcrR family transcriptional regulator [Alkalicoccobacillus murimartini]|uniref:AcrR family transcriptional regulator n=1 Tax=Alkalicoccobacillus murimartini TaxID=171685 RepID=A0ABT9YM17_9BACI|nr:TetR/AcrR family transcriptional regulator [Alkalicoccobacillus murimartini]MDQ0208689.1 AcrR family transcriptional regulator [Alkalicoccobacillus murimartini]
MSAKRQQILDTAETLFYENGFHHIGLKQIVKESNVALMTLYNHFDSKEELIQEILRDRETRYLSLLSTNEHESMHKKAKSIANIHIHWLSFNRHGCMLLRAKEEFFNVNESIVHFVLEHKMKVIQTFLSLGFTQTQSYQLTLLLEGATSLSEVLDPKEVGSELEQLVDQLFDK